jgi:C-terminal processing protease CtpA/Prc
MRSPFLAVLLAWAGALSAQDPPRLVSLAPANGSEVDAKTKQLVIVFDRAMSRDAYSLCGGGPEFPPMQGRPQWRDDRTLVCDVTLAPDRSYRLSINCGPAQNTRSAAGQPLAPVVWSFHTLPRELRPAAEQKQRNQQALTELLQVLATRYSHRDLRVRDWKPVEKELKQAVLAAKTDRGFAAAAAEVLKVTQDLHLYFGCGEQTFGTGSRQVDALYRRERVEALLPLQAAGPAALVGRTEDGIGYLMLATWGAELDPERIGGVITELADTKALVIDVRPNSGGDESLAQRVAAWFVVGRVTYAKNRYRERAGADGFGRVLARQVVGNDADRRYDKPIAVLTSAGVMSSCESFVLMLRQAKDCVVVGQPTFGSSGNPKPFELGNGVTAFVPTWQDLRPDGTPFEGEGLAPDVLVPCTAAELETRDPILERALELLRSKLATK